MSPTAKPAGPGWRTRDILRAAALVAAVYVALKLLWVGRPVFLIGFFGVLLGITLSAGWTDSSASGSRAGSPPSASCSSSSAR